MKKVKEIHHKDTTAAATTTTTTTYTILSKADMTVLALKAAPCVNRAH